MKNFKLTFTRQLLTFALLALAMAVQAQNNEGKMITSTDLISLHAGWNLISLDVIPTPASPEAVFALLISANNLQMVTGFQNQQGVFFDPTGLPFLNTLQNIVPGEGYWVKVTSETTLSVTGTAISPTFAINLKAGWNLICYWSAETITPEEAFAPLITAGKLLMVTGYEQGGKFYDPNGLPFLNTLTEIKNGFGYWVKVSSDYNGFSFPDASWQCSQSITITHISGNVAPVTKTVTYGTVTNIPGEPSKCWITSNLGADHQATAVNDATEASAGWYWQFNHKQGFKHTGSIRTPNSDWIAPITENLDWQTANDPCTLELGNGWRIPTSIEWTNVETVGNWTSWYGPWNSGLKLHAAGQLFGGPLYERGWVGYYWSTTLTNTGNASNLYFSNGASNMSNSLLAGAFTLRCLKDESPSLQLEVNPPNQNVTASAGETNFNIASNTTWSVTENNSWLSVSPLGGSNNGSLTVIYVENTSTDPRVGQIIITAEGGIPSVTVSIIQEGFSPFSCGQSFTDSRDGQTYTTVQIGTQCWMKQNLNIGIRIDGINDQTNNGTIEKYCYANVEINCDVYGGLYQWDEIMQYTTIAGVKGICPTNWHLPTDAEWTTLTTYVSSQTANLCNSNVDYIAKSLAATTNWTTNNLTCTIGNNLAANNATGFTALPGGYRITDGSFNYLSNDGFWWSSSPNDASYAWYRIMVYFNADVTRVRNIKSLGFSVRCLKD